MVIFNSYVNLPEGKWHGNIEIFACRLQLGLKNIIVLVNVLWFPLKSRHYQWKPSTTALTREELEILKVRERCNTCATSARARVHINSYTYISICVYIYIYILYLYLYTYPRVWVQAISIGPAWDSQGHVDAPVLHGPNGAHVHVLVEKLTLGMCG